MENLDEKEEKISRTPYLLTSIDLEMNPGKYEIIQVGACVGNLYTGEILAKESCIVKIKTPLHDYDEPAKRLCDITKLTGIKQEMVDNGMSLYEAYEIVRKIHDGVYTLNGKQVRPFRNPLTWGGGDSLELLNELNSKRTFVDKVLKRNIINKDFYCFGRRWIDVKTLFQTYMIDNEKYGQGGLSKSLLKMGLTFKGKKHDALDDAINTFYMRHQLFKLVQENRSISKTLKIK